ncbi:hypothetical protein NDU88_002844 [Pleurodeles waltl]|uniref:Uncharacterized protein n=1 Tax=Pleurodeles waltl TaxID=8319 RepID=A0AAV7VDR0_PLEWA|nr:hypothetical protein NDU88_002844 [Pleurodeles waltl]
MADARVQEAFRLLREAGRLDLVKSRVGGPSRPTRRASSGVAPAVLACSESRGAASRHMVSGRGGGRARARGEGRRNASRVPGARRVVARVSPAAKGAAGRTRPSEEGAPEAAAEKPRGRVLSRRGPAPLVSARAVRARGRVAAPRGRAAAAPTCSGKSERSKNGFKGQAPAPDGGQGAVLAGWATGGSTNTSPWGCRAVLMVPGRQRHFRGVSRSRGSKETGAEVRQPERGPGATVSGSAETRHH